jgi:LacI family transcriptional regulator
VVNLSPRVKPEVAIAVNAAIAQLNYVPNRAARMLASRRTQVIALVVPESVAKVFVDPFFASVIQGVALYLAETEYTLNMVIASEANPDKTRRYLMGGNVDGALVVSHHSGDHSYAHLGQTLPIVFGGRPVSSTELDSFYVDVDNVTSASVATQHLIDTGCRHIATIAGEQDMPAGIDRLKGWQRAVESAGLDASMIETGDFSPRAGAEAMRRLLDLGKPIDGVFAANDQMASGAISVLRERGFDVPKDVSVVGFDGDYFGENTTPPLTTIAQQASSLGAKMAEVLVDIIDGKDVPRVTIMPTELVARLSTKSLQASS